MNADALPPARIARPRVIGVFDSGAGGLSVMHELMHRLPDWPIVYLADQVHAPYGRRSLEEIRHLARGISRFLLDEGADVIVIACNTASAAALHPLRAEMPNIKFVGMEPAVKPAAERTRTGHVGVIATQATFQGELFAALLDRYSAQVAVHTQVCPDLVALVEAGELDSERARQAVANYLAPLLAAGIDELVLGCTHYPFLRPLIEQAAGPNVEIIDPAPAVARQTERVLSGAEQNARTAPSPQHRFYTTGDPARFSHLLQQLIGVEADVRRAYWIEGDRLIAAPSRSSL